jgi:hypothetical protein
MPKFMLPEKALARLIEDEGASIADRVRALKMIGLCMLRRILHRSQIEPNRVPSRLLAAAALAYAREVQVRRMRPVRPTYRRGQKPQHDDEPQDMSGNSLGI